jgi:serine-type D-Ala-D-Ala endopeptidase (penicillin-binding protein 7)
MMAALLALPAAAQASDEKPTRKTSASATKAHRAKAARSASRKVVVREEPVSVSFGQQAGLHDAVDALSLKSAVALVLDQDTDEVLFSKNPQAVVPIASITKLMTALVVVEAKQPLDEMLTITQDDVDTEKHSSSRLVVGTQLSREEMLHLALMSSENRAAHALCRYYPAGLAACISAMNHKAQELSMHDTHYVEPTGLSSQNQSSAHDLAALVKTVHEVPLIREMSTSPEYRVAVGRRNLQFRTTNALVRSPQWDIGVQKTGYISEAGRCLVMQASLAGRKLIMVFLDSAGKYSRIADAERVRKWVSQLPPSVAPAAPAAAPAPVAPAATTATGVKVTS